LNRAGAFVDQIRGVRRLMLGRGRNSFIASPHGVLSVPGTREIFKFANGGCTMNALFSSRSTPARTRRGRAALLGGAATLSLALASGAQAQEIVVANGEEVSTITGTAIHADVEDVLIEEGGLVHAPAAPIDEYPSQQAILVRVDNGTLRNNGLIREDGEITDEQVPNTLATGVLLGADDGGLLERATLLNGASGRIIMHGGAVKVGPEGALIVNDGLIQSNLGAAIEGSNDARTTVRNNHGGIIRGVMGYLGSSDGGDLMVNAGTIEGDILLADGEDAYLSGVDAQGNVRGSASADIDGGAGANDAYGRSYDLAGQFTYQLSNNILNADPDRIYGFERHGVEAASSSTEVVLTDSGEALTNGITLYGSGTITNQSDIAVTGSMGVRVGWASSLRFVNEAGANISTLGGFRAFDAQASGLRSFVNRGVISSQSAEGVVVQDNNYSGDFLFDNRGEISGANATYIALTSVQNQTIVATVNNSGRVNSNESFVYVEGDINFTNTGTWVGNTDIEGVSVSLVNHNQFYGGITRNHALDIYGRTVSVINSGSIFSEGPASVGMYVHAKVNDNNSTLIRNNGIIDVSGLGVQASPDVFILSSAIALLNTNAIVENLQGGIIRSAASGSSAIVVSRNNQSDYSFSLFNEGSIAGSGSDTFANRAIIQGGELGFDGISVASAIQTAWSTDTIVNRGAGEIIGNVGLANMNDRFENHDTARLEGDLRMGTGNDALVVAGGTIIGAVDMGDDNDIAELSGGTIGGNIDFGVGNDTATLSGTASVNGLFFRDGDDEFVMTGGTVAANVNMGEGNDSVELRGGTIGASIVLGVGDDILRVAGGTLLAADGGVDDFDSIQFDRSVANHTIDVTNFENFEEWRGFGTGDGVVTASGTFDYSSVQIADIHLRVAEGDELIVPLTFVISNLSGSEAVEQLTIDGTLSARNTGLAQGDDRVTVSGTINGSLSMGQDNDTFIMTAGQVNGSINMDDDDPDNGGDDLVRLTGGAISGDLIMGAGNDRLEWTGGTIGGAIDGGFGENTIAFTLTQDEGGGLAAFQNFQIAEVGGNFTLTADLDNGYRTISLVNGADLILNAGAGASTVTTISGDGSDQNVTINLSNNGDSLFSGAIRLGEGNDTLTLNNWGGTLGDLEGGGDQDNPGADVLNLNLVAETTFSEDVSGFENINVSGNAVLVVADDFASGQTINFQNAGTNRMALGAGANFAGVANAAGTSDQLVINTHGAEPNTLISGALNGFENVRIEGVGFGTAELTGASYEFGRVIVNRSNLTIGAGTEVVARDGISVVSLNDFVLTLAGDASIEGEVDAGESENDDDRLVIDIAQGQTTNISGYDNFVGFDTLVAMGRGQFVIDQATSAFDRFAIDGGHIVVNQGIAFASAINGGDDEDEVTNNGTITGDIILAGANDTVTNNGAITGAVSMGDGDDTVTNTGTITGNVDMGAENDVVRNYGTINGNLLLGDGDDTYYSYEGGKVTGDLNGGAGDNALVVHIEDFDIDMLEGLSGFNSAGVYDGDGGTLDLGLNGQNFARFVLDGDLTLKVTGNGSIGTLETEGDGAQTVSISSDIVEEILLGGGDDTLNLDLNGSMNTIDGGEGSDTLNIRLLQSASIDGATGFEVINVDANEDSYLAITERFGADQTLRFTGDADNSLIVMAEAVFEGTVYGGAGTDTLTLETVEGGDRTIMAAQVNEFERMDVIGGGTVALTGASYDFRDGIFVEGGDLELGQDTQVNGEAGIEFTGTHNNRLTLATGAVVQGGVDAGAGNDTLVAQQASGYSRDLSDIGIIDNSFENLVLSGAGTFNIDEAATFTSLTVDGGVTNVAVGAVLNAPVTGGANADTVNVAGTLNGTADLGEGDNSLSVAGTMTGNVVTGSGIDTVAIAGTGRLTGDILTGAGNDSVTALGVVDGNIDLGDGNDTFVYGGNVTGSITGGENEGDNDTLEFRTAGTYEAPTVYNGTDFTGFESLAVSGGVVSLSASQEWNDINVAGGRLIGQAGTVITSVGTIDVGQGGTFGSAGTVNGNIVVAQGGILSPGASPGTMIVNGNVTMQRGSNLLIELTPTAGTDLLDVNGTLTIAEGAAIDITGALSSLPGNVLDIVIADTISGRFTTVNKSSTVFGFVVQNGNRIQIRSEFQTDGDMPTNVEASVDYANQVLRSGYGVQAFTSALNVLTDADGTINQRTFAQLTPEAYGSAVQVSVENGLQIVDTTRTLKVTTPKRDGLYGFAQGLIGGGDMRGQADTGASRADYKTNGFFGGVGYGMGEGRMQVGAFLGKIDTDQDLSTLGARTEADGWVAGLYADAAVAGLGVHGMVAYTDTDATTTRNLAVTAEAGRGDYGLKTLVADLSVDYNLEMGGMNVTPKVGVTYVNTKRDGVTEDGAGDFALVVDGASKDAWFADAGVQVSGTMEVAGLGVTPYAEAGVRQMLSDENILVTGHFDGATGAPIVVNGIERDKTVARVGLGFGLDLTENVRFHSGYTTEFSNTNRSSFTAGASIRF
jgi:fibronectin-binding autotransporter adhesin